MAKTISGWKFQISFIWTIDLMLGNVTVKNFRSAFMDGRYCFWNSRETTERNLQITINRDFSTGRLFNIEIEKPNVQLQVGFVVYKHIRLTNRSKSLNSLSSNFYCPSNLPHWDNLRLTLSLKKIYPSLSYDVWKSLICTHQYICGFAPDVQTRLLCRGFRIKESLLRYNTLNCLNNYAIS